MSPRFSFIRSSGPSDILRNSPSVFSSQPPPSPATSSWTRLTHLRAMSREPESRMANTTADHPSAVRPKPLSPRIPSLLQRQPSQQELEAAQHLVEHSKGAQHAAHPQEATISSHATHDSPQVARHQGSGVLHGTDDVARQGSRRASPAPSSASAVADSRQSPMMTSLPPGGQQCRYDCTFLEIVPR